VPNAQTPFTRTASHTGGLGESSRQESCRRNGDGVQGSATGCCSVLPPWSLLASSLEAPPKATRSTGYQPPVLRRGSSDATLAPEGAQSPHEPGGQTRVPMQSARLCLSGYGSSRSWRQRELLSVSYRACRVKARGDLTAERRDRRI
jgi:hypothetical protein